jgi:hypothetical protein
MKYIWKFNIYIINLDDLIYLFLYNSNKYQIKQSDIVLEISDQITESALTEICYRFNIS